MSDAGRLEMIDEQKKPKRQRKKSMRGQPEMYEQIKKCVSHAITLKATKGLGIISKHLGISRSEVVEQIGRGILRIPELEALYEKHSDFFNP